MAIITIHSDLGAQENKINHYFHFFPIYLPWSEGTCGERNGNPLQCSCLENPRDGGACWAAIYGVTQSRTLLKWLSSSGSSRFVIAFLPRSKRLLFSWLQSPSTAILEPKKIKLVTASTFSPSICLGWWDQKSWSLYFLCWVLNQVFHFPLSPSLRGFSIPLHFLSLE